MPMHVHLACDIDPDDLGNPLLRQLRDALRADDGVMRVTAGRALLWDGPARAQASACPDVLHLHWPEALIEDWQEPSDAELQALGTALRVWRRRGTAVVVTIHNEVPHRLPHSARYHALYRLTYAHADAFVHMGQASVAALFRRYGSVVPPGACHPVIPHGTYDVFPAEAAREASRGRLGYAPGDALALAFGALRHAAEVRLLVAGFEAWRAPQKRLLVAASRLPRLSRKTWSYYRMWGPLVLNPRISVEGRFIPDRAVQYYLRATDVLVIPRVRALNSGNVALGFTFGRVVVGPHDGVIGEVLRQTGNPTYDPADPATLGHALACGHRLARAGHGAVNQQYARTRWNWTTLARQHAAAYRAARRRATHRLGSTSYA